MHRSFSIYVLCTFLLMLVCVACDAPVTSVPVSKPEQAEPLTPLSLLDEARLLALAESGADDKLGKELRRHQKTARSNPTKLDHWILVGQSWVQHARRTSKLTFYRNAEAAVRLALASNPKSPLALNLQGLILLSDHRFKEARDVAQRILSDHPQNPMALGTLSDALLELGDIEGASVAIDAMMDIKPNLPSYSRSAYAMWLRGDVEGAQEAIRLAFDAGRGHRDTEPLAWVLVQAAQLFWHQGDLEGAEAGLTLALEVFPNYPQALVAKARVLMARSEWSPAIALLERAMERSPLCSTAWLLGDAYTASGQDQAADNAYQRTAEIGEREDKRCLAHFYASRNENTARAVELAAAEYVARPGLYTTDVYAWTLYRAGRLDEAQKLAAQLGHFETPDARLLYHRGAIHLAAGKREQGLALLKKALELNPHFDRMGARHARMLLSATTTNHHTPEVK